MRFPTAQCSSAPGARVPTNRPDWTKGGVGGWLVTWPWGGWPCVTQGLACVTETAETAETADRYMRFWAPTKETQPRSTKRNPNFGRTLAVPWVLRRRNAGAARGGSTRKDAPGLPPRAAGHGAIFGPFLAVFRPFFCIFVIFYRSEWPVRCMRYTLK